MIRWNWCTLIKYILLRKNIILNKFLDNAKVITRLETDANEIYKRQHACMILPWWWSICYEWFLSFPELIIFCSSLAKWKELYLHVLYPAAFVWNNIFNEHSFAMSLISSFLLLASISIPWLSPFPFRLLKGNIKEFYFHKYSSLKNEPKESCFITTLHTIRIHTFAVKESFPFCP